MVTYLEHGNSKFKNRMCIISTKKINSNNKLRDLLDIKYLQQQSRLYFCSEMHV